MKLTVDNATVARGGCVRRERVFNMKATAKSFQILSAGLYTDHFAAILRELGCNSADSNTKAGKPLTPIRVHLPNTLEPFLSIEDDGMGLDDVEVRGEYVCPNCEHTEDSDFDKEVCSECGCKLSEANFEPGIYTTYFESDKTDAEDLTGCLGLGSKTPLAYTDQFSVVAVKDGIRNVYSACLNEAKMPAIVRLHTEKTTDGNSVKVELGVNPDDFAKFEQTAGYVYQWFTTKPEITGVEDFTYPEDQTFLMETEDYGIVDKGFNEYSSGGATAVLMGNVRYTLNYGDFDYKTQNKFSKVEAMLLKHGVFLKVSLKEGCDVAASREKLQMTARSVETIKAKLAIVEMDCLVEVQKRIDECTSIWDARIKYDELMSKTILGAIAKKSEVDPTWKGRECNPMISFTSYRDEAYLEYPRDDNRLLSGDDNILPGPPQQKFKKIPVVMAKGSSCYLRSPQRGRSDEDIFDKSHGLEGVKVGNNVHVFIQDVAHGSYAAVERFLRDNYGSTVVLIAERESYTLQTFLDDSGLSEVTKLVSTLPKPERQANKAKQKKTAKAVRFVGGDRYQERSSYMWEDHTIEDLDEGGVYVEVNRYNWSAGKLSNNEMTEPRFLSNHVTKVRAFDPNLGEVVGLRKALIKKVENNPNWVRLDQHIVDLVKADADLLNDAIAYGVWLAVKSGGDEVKNQMDSLHGKDWAAHSTLGSLLNETELFRNCGSKEVRAFRNIRENYGYIVDEHLPTGVDYTSLIEGLKKQWETIAETYPMMRFVSWNWSMRDDKLETVVDYINSVDGHTPKVGVIEDEVEAA